MAVAAPASGQEGIVLTVPRGKRQLTLLNPKQAARFYDVTEEEMYEALRKERLPFRRLGKWNILLVLEELPEEFPFSGADAA